MAAPECCTNPGTSISNKQHASRRHLSSLRGLTLAEAESAAAGTSPLLLEGGDADEDEEDGEGSSRPMRSFAQPSELRVCPLLLAPSARETTRAHSHKASTARTGIDASTQRASRRGLKRSHLRPAFGSGAARSAPGTPIHPESSNNGFDQAHTNQMSLKRASQRSNVDFHSGQQRTQDHKSINTWRKQRHSDLKQARSLTCCSWSNVCWKAPGSPTPLRSVCRLANMLHASDNSKKVTQCKAAAVSQASRRSKPSRREG